MKTKEQKIHEILTKEFHWTDITPENGIFTRFELMTHNFTGMTINGERFREDDVGISKSEPERYQMFDFLLCTWVHGVCVHVEKAGTWGYRFRDPKDLRLWFNSVKEHNGWRELNPVEEILYRGLRNHCEFWDWRDLMKDGLFQETNPDKNSPLAYGGDRYFMALGTMTLE